MKKNVYNKIFNPFFRFFKNESASGIILLIFAIAAIIIANSSFATTYDNILSTHITIGYKDFFSINVSSSLD